jgi:cytoskeletal protein CcmA (bactofilin family)
MKEERMSRGFPNDTSSDNEGAKCASIGASITIKGEISGAEDLVIEGTVEGTVNLREHTVVVGASAKVNADIYANVIRVEGQVAGDLFGREQISVQKTGCVRGNITAPRLALEDGARLKGAIDTEPSTGDSLNERLKSTVVVQTQSAIAAPAKDLTKRPAATTRDSVQ